MGHDADRLTVGHRLRSEMRRRFVGRTAERALFERLLTADQASFCVLWMYGPGGVGKTALCGVFADLARTSGRSVVSVDARDLEITPTGLADALGEPAPGQVTIIDTFERCTPLETWLRQSLLPGWPADGILVISGRHPPSAEWLGDAGWQGLLRTLLLRNLRPEESREFLRSRGIASDRQEAVIGFTHGHPLALALMAQMLADGDRLVPVRAEQEPELMRVLLERFVDRVPSPRHRAALAACAHLRVTTEEALTEVLDADDAGELFDWLRGLSFIEQGPHGLFPHDLARDVLDAELRWRNPPAYRKLHTVARTAAVRRIQTTDGEQQQRALFDFLFMHRNSPVMSAYQDWESFGRVHPTPASQDLLPQILAMVERHEGRESARIAERWYARQPRAFTAFRDVDGQVVGFAATVSLHEAAPEDLDVDPAARAAMSFIRRHGPLRFGDEALYHRYFLSRDTYQTVSAATNLFALTATRHWLTRPRLAWTFLAVADPAYWQPLFDYLNLRRSEAADFEVGGRRYGVFSHEWRVEPPLVWLELMEERELSLNQRDEWPRGPVPAPPLIVLSEPQFRAAVRQALRDYTRPSALAASPLLRSRVVVDEAGPQPQPEDLRRILRNAIESLRANPRDEKLYRALHCTYLEPAATQELAAERLGLPFSTYRSHLTAGIDRITRWLWCRELGTDLTDI